MNGIGASIARQISDQYPGLRTHQEKVEKLVEVMDQLGYKARDATPPGGEAVIEAENCVFHAMAKKDLASCHLDRGLMEAFTGAR